VDIVKPRKSAKAIDIERKTRALLALNGSRDSAPDLGQIVSEKGQGFGRKEGTTDPSTKVAFNDC
jgi:hypothetical protein